MYKYNDNNSLYNNKYLAGKFHLKTKAYYFKEWNEFRMQLHTHDAVEIMYVINGHCLIETEDTSITMKKGDFMLIDANIAHRLQVDKPCRMLNVEFGFYDRNSILPTFGEIVQGTQDLKKLIHSNLPYIMLKDSDEVYITLKSLIMELDRDDSNDNLLVQLLFDQLLLRISRLYCEKWNKNPMAGVMHVKKAVQFMHQYYDRNIQANDIAEAVSIHPGYLYRIFKSNKGCTLNEYLTRIRLEKAKTLLTNTDIQISDIPSYVGINSRQYFAFIFKKHTGLSPVLYRKTSAKVASKY